MEETIPVERFVTFMPNQGHKAQEMFDGLSGRVVSLLSMGGGALHTVTVPTYI